MRKIASAIMYEELITQNARHCALDCENPIIDKTNVAPAPVEFKIWWERKKIMP